MVREVVITASEQARALQNRTEVEDSSLLEPLQQLLMEVQEVLESRTIASLTSNITSTYTRLCNLIEVFLRLLQRLLALQRRLTNSRNQTTVLNTQLDTLITRLDSLTVLLRNLSHEAMLLGPLDPASYITMLQEAEMRSNRSYDIVHDNVTRLAQESEGNLAQLEAKLPVFLNLQNMTRTLLRDLWVRIREFLEFIDSASVMLCGTRGGGGCGECGGVMCDTCGGGRCNGSVAQVQRATNITQQARETTDRLYRQLMAAISVLTRARNVSEDANSTSSMAEQEARMAARSSRELLRSIQELLAQVQDQLMKPLPNVTLIELLQNETLSLQLEKTPEEVNDH